MSTSESAEQKLQQLQSLYNGLDALMSENQLDAVLITSRDCQLSEYTPLVNNTRYQLTAFTGSVGDAIYLSEALAEKLDTAQCLLFVDGRYHLQADLETLPALVNVQKLAYGEGMWPSIMAWLEANQDEINKVGFDGYRFSSGDIAKLADLAQSAEFSLQSFNHREMDDAIALPGMSTVKPINQLDDSLLGRSIADNIKALQDTYPQDCVAATTCYVTALTDDVAYLLNSRGYHSENQSAHFGFLFVVGDKLALYLPRECCECDVNIDNPGALELTVIRNDLQLLGEWLKQQEVTALCYSNSGINFVLQQLVNETCQGAKLYDEFKGVTPIRAVKNEQELKAMKKAFIRSSVAIAETIRWAKYGDEEDRVFTEGCMAAKLWDEYEAQGAISLSFSTIAGCGENGAIIHYSDAESTRPLRDGELVLLDSGAYYEEGLATDITRGCFVNHDRSCEPEAWQKDIYTATLKASIAGLTARIPDTTTGAELDKLIRTVIQGCGYDYAHGTGHGVGIDVHESGIGISPRVESTLTENAVVTIEPGIYLEGRGGVRVENVVIVRRDEFHPEQFHFENLSFVGYDWDLINLDQLDEDEKDYLKSYEHKCQELGTEITRCPLL